MAERETETKTGTVESTNDKGLKLGGAWFNYSNYFKGTRANRGDNVSMEVDGKFINSLTVTASGAPTNGTKGSSSGGRSPDTDARIARQVALKASVERAAGTVATTAEVISQSRDFEKYLNEPTVATDASQLGF